MSALSSTSCLPTTPRLAWYRVPEVWLILVLLGATVIGSISLVVTAVRRPDVHVVVPGDVPRPSKIPPIHPEPARAPARAD